MKLLTSIVLALCSALQAPRIQDRSKHNEERHLTPLRALICLNNDNYPEKNLGLFVEDVQPLEENTLIELAKMPQIEYERLPGFPPYVQQIFHDIFPGHRHTPHTFEVYESADCERTGTENPIYFLVFHVRDFIVSFYKDATKKDFPFENKHIAREWLTACIKRDGLPYQVLCKVLGCEPASFYFSKSKLTPKNVGFLLDNGDSIGLTYTEMCEIISTIQGEQERTTKMDPEEISGYLKGDLDDPYYVGNLPQKLYNEPLKPYKCKVTQIHGALKIDFTKLYVLHLIIDPDKRYFLKHVIFESCDDMLQKAEYIVSLKDIGILIDQLVYCMGDKLDSGFIKKMRNLLIGMSFTQNQCGSELTVDTITKVRKNFIPRDFAVFMKPVWK